jgi:hypothetical protein
VSRAAQHRPDPAAELGEAERLGDVVIRTCLEPEHGVRLGVERRQHDDRNYVAPAAQGPAHLVAVGPRAERDIEQDDVELVGARAVDRRAPVGDRHHPVAFAGERPHQHLAQVRLVVDNEDAERCLSGPGSRA